MLNEIRTAKARLDQSDENRFRAELELARKANAANMIGTPWGDIADALGLGDRSAAHNWVKRRLKNDPLRIRLDAVAARRKGTTDEDAENLTARIIERSTRRSPDAPVIAVPPIDTTELPDGWSWWEEPAIRTVISPSDIRAENRDGEWVWEVGTPEAWEVEPLNKLMLQARHGLPMIIAWPDRTIPPTRTIAWFNAIESHGDLFYWFSLEADPEALRSREIQVAHPEGTILTAQRGDLKVVAGPGVARADGLDIPEGWEPAEPDELAMIAPMGMNRNAAGLMGYRHRGRVHRIRLDGTHARIDEIDLGVWPDRETAIAEARRWIIEDEASSAWLGEPRIEVMDS